MPGKISCRISPAGGDMLMIMSDTDLQLLARYARDRAEDAFAEVVRRHVDFVYSAALRQVRSSQLAEEVAQSVFTDLAKNLGRLKPDTILTAWLYQVARRTSTDVVRREARRQLRERIATEMTAMNATEATWPDIEPLLDEAVSALDDTDRAAVLLRYFENKSLREVGAQLAISDDAAQKRVSRAVDRLREFFTKRGVSVGGSALAIAISANAVHAAPAGLAITISTAALASTAVSTATVIATTTTTIAMTALQKTLVTAAVTALAGVGIYEARQAVRRGEQVQQFQQMTTAQQELEKERTDLLAQLAALRAANDRANSNAVEADSLRAELARLRKVSSEPAKLPSPAANSSTVPADQSATPTELPKDSWADVGFATPLAALQTRGWAVLNSNRERFKESVLITDAARKAMEEMLEKMIANAPAAERQRFSQQILSNNLGLEDAMLFPMIAENQSRGYTSYRILSERSLADDERQLEVETGVASGAAKRETLRFKKSGDAWKVVIDESFIKSQSR